MVLKTLFFTLILFKSIIPTETRAYKASYTDSTSKSPTTAKYMKLLATFFSNKFTPEQEIGKI